MVGSQQSGKITVATYLRHYEIAYVPSENYVNTIIAKTPAAEIMAR